jgi:hypothetical protein
MKNAFPSQILIFKFETFSWGIRSKITQKASIHNIHHTSTDLPYKSPQIPSIKQVLFYYGANHHPQIFHASLQANESECDENADTEYLSNCIT